MAANYKYILNLNDLTEKDIFPLILGNFFHWPLIIVQGLSLSQASTKQKSTETHWKYVMGRV